MWSAVLLRSCCGPSLFSAAVLLHFLHEINKIVVMKVLHNGFRMNYTRNATLAAMAVHSSRSPFETFFVQQLSLPLLSFRITTTVVLHRSSYKFVLLSSYCAILSPLLTLLNPIQNLFLLRSFRKFV